MLSIKNVAIKLYELKIFQNKVLMKPHVCIGKQAKYNQSQIDKIEEGSG